MSGIPDEILGALRRRGLSLRETDHGGETLAIARWSPRLLDMFYSAMQRYSFRLVLRDVIRLARQAKKTSPAEGRAAEGAFGVAALTRHASSEAVQEHLATLLELGLVSRQGDEYRLAVQAESLGPTLEWFVAEVLRRELGFCVGRGIPLRGGQTGGDLDVVGVAEGKLLLVEVKSGPPKHLSTAQIGAFLDRVQAVAPHGAIFFDDTELRMADKVVVLFEEVLRARGWDRRPLRLQRELFTVGPGIYIANANPEVALNLTCCVSHLLRAQALQL